MGGGLQCESFFWLVGSDVTGWCSGNHWIGALVSVEELKDIVICIPWGRTRILAYHCIVAFLLFPCFCVCAQSLNSVWLFVTPWTVAHQPPPSMGFSRQEYWSGILSNLRWRRRCTQLQWQVRLMSDHEGLLQAAWIFIFVLKSVEETWKYFKEEVTFFKCQI